MTRIEFILDNGIRFVISKDTQKAINNVIHTAYEFCKAVIKLAKEKLQPIFNLCEDLLKNIKRNKVEEMKKKFEVIKKIEANSYMYVNKNRVIRCRNNC
ncbi:MULTISPECIES: hypothetical protein [Clostridium]|uniref:Uncharacterized protein n=1 Tax=Clostridium carnis TaxID=1530 RepID=A0ABY6T0W7_9CLOT|nr:hypothetical protein [Clostridium carnis]VDG74210.1 Uncharacterised protein [Clostridium carnis]